MLGAALVIAIEGSSPNPSALSSPFAAPSAPASATPAPSPNPAPTATPAYLYSYVPPASVPPSKILEIDLNDRRLHAPGDVRVRILTSNDVVSVILRAMGREIALPRLIPGLFAGEDKIPHVPFFMRGRTYDVDFVAATGDGQTTTITIPVELLR